MTNPQPDVNELAERIAALAPVAWEIDRQAYRQSVAEILTAAALNEREGETPSPAMMLIKKRQIFELRQQVEALQRSNDVCLDRLKQVETRLPCGHWQGDWVPTADSTISCEATETTLNCVTTYRVGYCRTCKQQAEAVAQARLSEAKWWKGFIVSDDDMPVIVDESYVEAIKSRIAELEQAVKESE